MLTPKPEFVMDEQTELKYRMLLQEPAGAHFHFRSLFEETTPSKKASNT